MNIFVLILEALGMVAQRIRDRMERSDEKLIDPPSGHRADVVRRIEEARKKKFGGSSPN